MHNHRIDHLHSAVLGGRVFKPLERKSSDATASRITLRYEDMRSNFRTCLKREYHAVQHGRTSSTSLRMSYSNSLGSFRINIKYTRRLINCCEMQPNSWPKNQEEQLRLAELYRFAVGSSRLAMPLEFLTSLSGFQLPPSVWTHVGKPVSALDTPIFAT